MAPLLTTVPSSFRTGVPVHVPAELIAVTSEEGEVLPVVVMLKLLLVKSILFGKTIAATAGVALVKSTFAE